MKKETALLLISFCCFAGTGLGLVGFTLFAFMNFTYRGSGLDWIYPLMGFLSIAWIVSAAAFCYLAVKVALKSFRSVSIK